MSPRIGVLALQGGVAPHRDALRRARCTPVDVRAPTDLHGLILPGGESTTQHHLLATSNLLPALTTFVHTGHPVLATCAGLILAARYGWLPLTVARNAYGPQRHSHVARSDDDRHELVLIRAPKLLDLSPHVEVWARYRGDPVGVRHRNVWGAAFHPELSPNATLHAEIFCAEHAPLAPSAREIV